MDLTLQAPTYNDVQTVARWRQHEDVRPTLRTNRMLTEFEQANFWESLSETGDRYWSLRSSSELRLKAFTGLTNIDWQAGHAEISLLVDPGLSWEPWAEPALHRVLDEAFHRMRLVHVFGECYYSDESVSVTAPRMRWWLKQLELFQGGHCTIPGRKFWDGKLYGALLFWFKSEQW